MAIVTVHIGIAHATMVDATPRAVGAAPTNQMPRRWLDLVDVSTARAVATAAPRRATL
ncbi:MAG: hypothetical protein IPG03_14085 [Candidatus Microthrix sp.]|nr:hypothetical protein [Candidatus Microthrix sp.]MBK6503428.1 hypothetical protein [Candidatus Microthrix sp.]